MNNKHTPALLKQQFWASFGRYMAPVPSAEGIKTNWINYKTGVKDLHFSMQVDNSAATISIVLTHADTSRQALLFNKLRQVKNVLTRSLQEEWQWTPQVPDEHHKMISRIYTSLEGVSIFRQSDWPRIISFLKPRIIALDACWNEVGPGFRED